MYADYRYYELNYGGKMPDDDYDIAERKAEAYIRSLTFAKGDIFKVENPSVKDAVCAVADVFYSQSEKNHSSNGPVKSENNDGYSVTYVTEQTDGQTVEEVIKKKAYQAAYMYLMPAGWLSGKVRCGHAHECRHHDLQP